MADRVHPTAFGQIAIAERALAVLAGDGMTIRVDPAALITYETTRAAVCGATSAMSTARPRRTPAPRCGAGGSTEQAVTPAGDPPPR